MGSPFDRIGVMFPRVAARWAGSVARAAVTVRQIDNDTGATRATTVSVPALKRARKRQPLPVQGGEVGNDTCRFVLHAAAVGFLPADGDEITDAAGVVWQMDSVELIAFGQLYACDVTIKR